MWLEGKGPEAIARILSERKVLNYTYYWEARGNNRNDRKWQEDPYNWKCSIVDSILRRVDCYGDLINFKTYSKSFKNKKRFMNPDEKHVIFRGIHEPIIDPEAFELVQKLRGKVRTAHRRRKTVKRASLPSSLPLRTMGTSSGST